MKSDVKKTLPLMACVALMGAVLSARPAIGGVLDLMEKLPSDANAVVTVDVDALRTSAQAKREGWFDESMPRKDKGSVFVPRGSRQVVVATQLDDKLEIRYGVSLAELMKPVSIDAIALAEGMPKEPIEGKEAVTSRGNVAFVKVKETRLATVFPGDRQSAARVATGSYQGVSSDYLKGAVKGADGAQIVMALDTFGMFSPGDLYRRIDARPIKAVDEAGIEPKAFAKLLSEINGVTLRVTVTDSINGVVTVDFGTNTDLVKKAVKPVMLETMTRVGLNVTELSGWTFTASGNRVKGEGKMSLFTVKRLASLLNAPTPAALDPEEPAKSAAEAADPKQAMAVASQKYFKKYTAAIDGFAQTPNLADQIAWLRRDAKRLSELPVKNVDPALVAWGDEVTNKMSSAARQLFTGKLDVKNARNSIDEPALAAASGGDYYNSDGGNAQLTAQFNNYRRQVRQATGEEYEKAAKAAGEELQGIMASKTKIRREMAEKYSVEF